jgi:hypothetical protein
MFRKDTAEALQQRKEIRVDPFRQGFDHANSPQTIDLNAVRLCFQVRYQKAKNYPYHRMWYRYCMLLFL